PDAFVRISGVKVKVVVYDIYPLREDYGVAPILLSVLREMARDTDIVVEYSADVLSEVSLTDKRIEDALEKTDADLLVFGSYVATRSNVQPLIHLICTYGRQMEPSADLPEGMDINRAIQEGDAILQMPRHILLREIMPVMAIETMSFQNMLAEEIFLIAQFIQAVKLYKAEKFEETAQMAGAILGSLGSPDQWPGYWVPFSYLHMLNGLAYLRMGNTQAAVFTLSNALTRSTPAKARIQRCAEQIIASLMRAQEQASETEKPAEAPAPG
ncbi:MAG: hypothetical protein IH586_16635, partial [Anaerolineaceae bacterium]|nr:hypothetical protein [Anaerolineaceae bacterium]